MFSSFFQSYHRQTEEYVSSDGRIGVNGDQRGRTEPDRLDLAKCAAGDFEL